MKIVIDIDERVLNDAKNGHVRLSEIADAVLNGTPLPTGEWILHGMIYYCSNCEHECGESGDNFCGNCGAKMKKEEKNELL